MKVLEVSVQGDDKSMFLKQGAIVTVSKIGESFELPRYSSQAVIDIGSDRGRARSPIPRRTSHSFNLPGNGKYEVKVRHPGGIETLIETFNEEDSAQRRMITVRARNMLQKNGDPQTVSRVRSVHTQSSSESNLRGSYPKLSIISSPDFGPSVALSDSVFGMHFRYAPGKLDFGFLEKSSIDGGEDIIAADRFADIFGSVVSPQFMNLHDIYLDLQQRPTKWGAPLPRWIEFANKKGREVASIPWLWLPAMPDGGRDVQIDIVEISVSKGRSPIRILTQDSRWDALLAYVAAGRMYDAETVANAVVKDIRGESYGLGSSLPEIALRDKVKDPLVAALGGLVLVSSVSDTKRMQWDPWLRNLANWFPGIPDGAAIYGYRLIQQGSFKEGHQWLRDAVSRGLPYFSATFRLLALGFAQLEDDRSLEKISAASVAVDPTQPFTVMSLSW